VSRLFSLSGSSDNSGVNFIFASDKTKTGTPVQVRITQAATQASLSAASALAASITVDSSNNTLGLTINGSPATVTLASGTYSPQTLVSELQSELASSSALSNSAVQVALDGNNRLSITSGSFGANSQVVTTGGNALATLGFAAGASTTGQNVAGSYLVGGVTEAAQGNGQILAGLSTNASTSGLQVRVSLGASQIPTGPAATVTVTRGLASRIGQILNSYLDPVNGRLKSLDQSFQDNISSIQTEITTDTTSMNAKQQALQLEFANMEATIAQLQTTGNFLAQQFNSLTGTSSSSSSAPKIG
jgi:flagellar hook-associated protein 2